MPYKDSEKRKAYNKEYRERNSATAYARVKAWREANPEKLAVQVQKYAEKHPEKLKEKALRHKRNNITKVREQNRVFASNFRAENKALVKKRKSVYQKKSSGVVNAAVARRKAVKLQRTPAWLTPDDFWLIGQAYELAALRTKMLGFSWHVDHVIPFQGNVVSGLHAPINLRVIPGVDNLKKQNSYRVL